MRRKLAYLMICLPLCLFLVPDRAPVALSISPLAPSEEYCEDGRSLPDDAAFERLARENAVAFLDACLKRYHREIKGYCGVMKKQERIGREEIAPELLDFWFREDPYSVLLKWRQGARGAKASLFVQNQNSNRVAVVATRLGVVWDIDPEGRFAGEAGRYSIREFSLRQATERTRRAWAAAQENGCLCVEYLGKAPVAELDGRTCYRLRRTCTPPEDGVATVELAIDAESWLQTGSILLDSHGNLVGKYQFCRLQINPQFDATQFERSALKK